MSSFVKRIRQKRASGPQGTALQRTGGSSTTAAKAFGEEPRSNAQSGSAPSGGVPRPDAARKPRGREKLTGLGKVLQSIESLDFQAFRARGNKTDDLQPQPKRGEPGAGRRGAARSSDGDARQFAPAEPQFSNAPQVDVAGRRGEVDFPTSPSLPASAPTSRSPAKTPRAPSTAESLELRPEAAGSIRRLDVIAEKTGGGRKPPWLFLGIFVLPVLVTAIYLVFFAADRYTTEASYIVRRGGATLSASSAIPGIGRSDDSSEAIAVYFKSRDAAEHLAKHIDLKTKLMHPSADFLTSYPGFFYDETNEGLFNAMEDAVDVEFDSDTGISTLYVTAFTPQDAKDLATALLTEAENLVNRMNDRATNDAIAFAKEIVKENENRVRGVQKRMTDFRNNESIIDPNAQSTAQLGLMTELSQQVTNVDTQIAQLRASAPKNPRLASLVEQRKALSSEVAEIRGELAGSDSSLAPKISAYENLALERDLAVQALTNAYVSLEEARQEAFANRLYLQTIATPNLPDRPSHPQPLFWTGVVALIFFGVWTVARTAFKETMEHST
ncbi:hypothetical protein [Jiella mangrovi]|uniref:Capsule biosynthesis protein n=1 Tax=Jiella mangrovi TaxID=2821407 RepID=A0ABS4BMH2_9HYPH|nr:hypothetical protein [Jiella mangrovi]MBP0617875.1 hypothetical protein [Jiella mangrovi]